MQPLFVIARGEVRYRVHLLDIVARTTGDRHSCDALHSVHAPFPLVVKYRFVLLTHDGTEPVHAAHIVNTVHACSPYAQSVTSCELQCYWLLWLSLFAPLKQHCQRQAEVR